MTNLFSAASPILALENLSVVLGGFTVLDIEKLDINSNEFLAIIGPNGSGKTTLLLTMALLVKPAGGRLLYRGSPVMPGDKLNLRRRFAMVFQEPLLLDSSVTDNVTLGLRLRGAARNEIHDRALHWLERFGIADLAKRQARTLSGGEAKRVSLARAFVLEPEVLFLDEPFAALDTPTHQTLLEDFHSVLHETRVSTVMVTHDHDEALLLGDRVAVLMRGGIAQVGTAPQVFSAPENEEIAGFIKAGNILHGRVIQQINGMAVVQIGQSQIEAVSDIPEGTPVTVYMHYEDVTLSLPGDEPSRTSARNRIKGRIGKVFPVGSLVRLSLEQPFPITALVTRWSCEEMDLVPGKEVVASFKASAIHLLRRE